MADPTPADRIQPVPLVRFPDRDRRLAHLPVTLTRFVGRDREVAAVVEVLRRPGVRLVTLTGPGGVGKTRLAVRAAEEVADDFLDGVWFVALASVREPALVAATVAQALGIRESGARSIEQGIRDILRDRRALLVLDNLEHLLEAGPWVADLLVACPSLTVLATSRAVLRISGEHVVAVPPLGLPPPDRGFSVARAVETEAVHLFAERARAARNDFAVTEANANAVAEVCRRLDGLPLAIELAAARVRHLSPAALLTHLEPRLPLLTGGDRDRPSRLRAMRDAIAWSYDLLSAREQALFRRLAVFAGGFTLRAAEFVTADWVIADRIWMMDGIGRPPMCLVPHRPSPSFFDDFAALVDSSLVESAEGTSGVSGSAGVPCYRMLETIREFGRERMEECGEAERIRDAHAAYYLALAHTAEAGLWGQSHRVWLDTHTAEQDNVRAALTWLDQSGQVEAALCLAYKIRFPWEERGCLGEIRGWLERLLARDGPVAPGVRAKALLEAGALALRQGDFVRVRDLCEPALALARGIGARLAAAEALQHLGSAATLQGDHGQAEALLAEALTLCREAGDAGLTYTMLVFLGEVAQRRGDTERARVRFGEALVAFRERIDLAEARDDTQESAESFIVAWPGNALVARDQGNLKRAASLCDEAAARFRALGSLIKIAETLDCAGSVALLAGNQTRAAAAYRESLALFWEDGDRLGCAGGLEGLAACTASDQAEHAARLFGAASAIRTALATPLPPSERKWYEPAIAAVSAALGQATFAAAWETGRALSIEQAVAEAMELVIESAPNVPGGTDAEGMHGLAPRELEVLRLLADGRSNREIGEALVQEPALPHGATDSAATHGLTRREREVLRLVAEGHTDREIAAALSIGERTVEWHLTNAFNKLGVNTRAAAAAAALRHGLI